MTARDMKPKFLLLDANIIIVAYETGMWKTLITYYEVFVPSIVVNDEALFQKKNRSIPRDIDLPELARNKEITEVSATVQEMASLLAKFDETFQAQIHKGEAEALALLNTDKIPTECFYCTGDKIAIQVLSMLGFANRGISLEALFDHIKVRLKAPLDIQYTKRFFSEQGTVGGFNLISGTGLNKKSG